MVSYKITAKPSAEKEIKKIRNKKQRQWVVDKIQQLENNPHGMPGCKKIVGGAPNTYRIRQRDYRVIFTIDDEARIVDIVKLARRDSIYKNRV